MRTHIVHTLYIPRASATNDARCFHRSSWSRTHSPKVGRAVSKEAARSCSVIILIFFGECEFEGHVCLILLVLDCIHVRMYAYLHHVYMYVCMYVCTYVCTYACINVFVYVCSGICMYELFAVCLCVCHACMYRFLFYLYRPNFVVQVVCCFFGLCALQMQTRTETRLRQRLRMQITSAKYAGILDPQKKIEKPTPTLTMHAPFAATILFFPRSSSLPTW